MPTHVDGLGETNGLSTLITPHFEVNKVGLMWLDWYTGRLFNCQQYSIDWSLNWGRGDTLVEPRCGPKENRESRNRIIEAGRPYVCI